MKWIVIAVVAIAALAAIVLVVGSLRPKTHVARCRADFRQSPEAVWSRIADLARWPEWNPAVRKAARKADRDGREVWITSGKWGDMPTVVERREPPHALRTRVADPNGSFEGTWTYEIADAPGGSTVILTERGSVSSPVFRFFMAFGDPHASMTEFLRSLAASFGEAASVSRVAVDPSEEETKPAEPSRRP
jgi:polyketide cyclase/dehydrase/lipid transport protein